MVDRTKFVIIDDVAINPDDVFSVSVQKIYKNSRRICVKSAFGAEEYFHIIDNGGNIDMKARAKQLEIMRKLGIST